MFSIVFHQDSAVIAYQQYVSVPCKVAYKLDEQPFETPFTGPVYEADQL